MSFRKSKGIANIIIVVIILLPLIGFGLSYVMFQPSISEMQKATVSASLQDENLSNPISHTITGTVINFGTATASEVTIVVKWLKQGASFHQEIITISSLAGRTVKDVSFSYVFGGGADELQYTVAWK
jgi:predicted permease